MAVWIWYPHDFEIELRGRVEARRTEHGMTVPSIWRMDAPGRAIAFIRRYALERPGRVRMHWQGEGWPYVRIDGVPLSDRGAEFALPAGEHELRVEVMNLHGLPALYLAGDVETDGSFWACENNVDAVPCGWSTRFDAPEKRPEDYALPTRPVRPQALLANGVIDFGCERFGFVHMKATSAGAYCAYYGESLPEALAGRRGETWDAGEFTCAGEEKRLPSRAMRYLRVEGPVDADSVWLEEEENGLTYRASFRSDDARLDAIYDVSARTMALCTREFFLDGIKRDRWVWGGDALQSVMMNPYSYFDRETSRRTLAALRGREPFDQHVSTILDYTFYWMIAVWEDYFSTGDDSFVRGMYKKMVSAMDYTRRFCSADGFVVGQARDWVFVDWADMSKEGELCVEQVLLWKALTVLKDCAALVGDAEGAAGYAQDAERLRQRILDIFWDDEKGTLLHQRVDGVARGHTRYAPMFALMYGMLDEEKQASVIAHSLLGGDAPVITTPYMRFYEMDALMRAGRARQVLDDVRGYWGGMLDLGATSVWEQFDPTEEGEAHYAMYGRPFGRSLCHCWGAGPIYLCGRYVLGVRPVEPGYARYEVAPQPAGLARVQGSVPAPVGDIRVQIEGERVRVTSTCPGRGELAWKGRRIPIPASDGTPVTVCAQ